MNDDWWERQHKVMTLAHNPNTIPLLVTYLADPHANVRATAIKALSNLGTIAIDALILATEHQTPLIRLGAIKALGYLKHEQATEVLIQKLNAKRPEEQMYAAEALGLINDHQAVPALIDKLQHTTSVSILSHVIAALGKIQDKSAVESLLRKLHHENGRVVTVTVWALGNINAPQAIKPLIDLLHHHCITIELDPATIFQDYQAHLGNATITGHTFANIPESIAIALRSFGEAAVQPVIDDLENGSSPSGRAYLIMTLGTIGDSRAIPVLKHLEASSEPGYQQLAAWALDQLSAAQ